jgi:hypothetical protein
MAITAGSDNSDGGNDGNEKWRLVMPDNSDTTDAIGLSVTIPTKDSRLSVLTVSSVHITYFGTHATFGSHSLFGTRRVAGSHPSNGTQMGLGSFSSETVLKHTTTHV